MGRKVPFWCSVRLQGRLLRPFSDSLSTHLGECIGPRWEKHLSPEVPRSFAAYYDRGGDIRDGTAAMASERDSREFH
jgi:hypothetical protein